MAVTISLKESRACAEMAKVLYGFLPGSGASQWKGHVSFRTVAEQVGLGRFWTPGSKEPAIARLLEKTLEHRRDRFESLILAIVRDGMKYREKEGKPITEQEIKTLNGLIVEVGFKFPAMWDPDFLASLRADGGTRAKKIVDQEMQAEKLRATAQSDKEALREKLKATFYALSAITDRSQAGLHLEKVLNGLFDLAGLSPRSAFRVTGEQIDGSFELDAETYLVEAKWEGSPLPEAPLLVFRGKIEGKSQFTRGVFVSISGFTPACLQAIVKGKQPSFFLIDGYDLATVLEGRFDLAAMFRAKLRLLNEEGQPYVSVKELS